jgi:hypothetical protein
MNLRDVAAALASQLAERTGFSPRRFVFLIAAVLAAVATIALVAFVRDPFGLGKAHRDRLERQAATASDLAALRGLEAKGEAAATLRVEAAQRQIRAVQAATATLTQTARNADDAATPIDADRLARLRAHDDSLCRSAPLHGCLVEVDDAADRQ